MAESSPDLDAQPENEAETAPKKKSLARRVLTTALKIGVSVGGLYYVYGKALGRDGLEELSTRLESLQWGWFVFAALMQMTAIAFAVVRWRLLLGGQGIRARWSFLIPSFMIGRFWGAFTPGGLGLDGWRLYDVATQSDKPARAVAVTTVEKILGQLAFGLVVMVGSMWGLELMGVEGLLLINGFFVLLVSVGLAFISRPAMFRPLFRLLPAQVQPRFVTLIDAVSAYRGKVKVLGVAVLCGVAVHAFNNLIYVSAAQAMQLELSPFVVFFASSIVIMSTIVPLSLNGVGLRESTAAAVLGAFGVAEPIAAATYTLGWVAEMCVSAIGLPIYWLRRSTFDAKLKIEDAEREAKIYEELAPIPESKWPKPARGLTIGVGAGLLAGMIVGLTEGSVIWLKGGGLTGLGVLVYGAVAYGIFCAIAGGVFGLGSAWVGRRMEREAVPEPHAYAYLTALMVAGLAFALGAFRIRRDVFHEEIAWKSLEGAALLAACAAAAALLYFALAFALRLWTKARPGRFLLRAWGSPVFVAVVIAVVLGVTLTIGDPAAANGHQRAEPPADAPNILVIVVDTLRADHLPGYGYDAGSTPALDRFAEDAVRYEQAFSNSSWTRPSFASILSGRQASSHGVMSKPSALPDEVETLAEALRSGGYRTAGFMTNINVGPFSYNFHQGFDDYRYLEPEFVLGADDAASRLLLIQVLRKVIEKGRAFRGTVLPGTAYQDGETVNRNLVSWLDERPSEAANERPWFLFATYMDPHDPYFPHPYDGTGYSRAAHEHPDLDEAEALEALYDGEITYWDTQFGALMNELRERGLYDDMMIIVTSDHGEEFGEHGGFWHGTTLYDEQVHVPLFVKLPQNARAGTHVGHWVQSIDLMPSILTHIGLEIPEGVQGGLLEEGTTRVYAEESHEGNVLESVREVRDFEELKLITANPDNPRGLEAVELYRVADDVGEERNVAEADRETTAAMGEVMGEARALAAEGALEAQDADIDEETRRRLCLLGYIDSEECCRDGLLPPSECN